MLSRPVLSLCPETVFRRTLWVIGTLVAASLGAAFMELETQNRQLRGIYNLVSLDKERNLPTYFSMLQLLAAGTITWRLGAREKVRSIRWRWCVLALGLVWIGCDEVLSIHEKFNRVSPYIGSWRQISFFHYAWVIPAFFVVAVCGVVMLKLLLSLPRSIGLMFALSGMIFVTGSVGAEMLSAHYDQLSGRQNWSYTLCYTIEETFEMLGPALFIRTALRYAHESSNGQPEATR
jgi:hypothetical protein